MKKQTKKNIVNYGLKVSVVLGVIGAISSIPKENKVVDKVILVAVTALVGGAQYIIADEMVKVLFDEQNNIKSKSLREILDSYSIKRRIKMTGWILFTAVISLVIGIVLGWILCTWALANYIIRNGTLLKKEEKDGGLQKAKT